MNRKDDLMMINFIINSSDTLKYALGRLRFHHKSGALDTATYLAGTELAQRAFSAASETEAA